MLPWIQKNVASHLLNKNILHITVRANYINECKYNIIVYNLLHTIQYKISWYLYSIISIVNINNNYVNKVLCKENTDTHHSQYIYIYGNIILKSQRYLTKINTLLIIWVNKTLSHCMVTVSDYLYIVNFYYCIYISSHDQLLWAQLFGQLHEIQFL